MAKGLLLLLGCCFVVAAAAVNSNNDPVRLAVEVYDECNNGTELVKCLKIKALKLVEKAAKVKSLEFAGVNIVKDNRLNRTSRAYNGVDGDDENLKLMNDTKINDLLYDAAGNFLETHSLNIHFPTLIEEARRRRNRFMGPLIAAVAIKGVMMAMAYKSIAVMAGTALIVGKMALVMATILGLKKLLGGQQEKTTFEIVKHPSLSSAHSYSSSLEEGEGHYHKKRSLPSSAVLESLRRNYA